MYIFPCECKKNLKALSNQKGFFQSKFWTTLLDLNTLNYYQVQFGINFFSDIYEIFILNFRDSNFQIWPNPANDRTTIFFQNNLSELYFFNLYNLSGEKLLSISTNENNIQLDCTIYYSGIYFFTLAQENNNFYKSGKMIINHL